MAHVVIGLDLGSSEVKAVALRTSLRGAEVVRVLGEPVTLDAEGRSEPGEIIAAAARLVERLPREGANLHCGIRGDIAAVRRLVVPLNAVRRLEQVARFELDDLLPFDVTDAMFDFVELGRSAEGISLLCAAVLEKDVRALIAALEEKGIEPREMGVGSLDYLTAWRGKEDGDVPAVIDLGHHHTDIAVCDPAAPTVRTVLRGGRDLTAHLAATFKLDYARAEEIKRSHGLTGKAGEALRQALRPLVREVQQTVKGHLAGGGRRVTRLILCGGGALLSGLLQVLADEIGVPSEIWEPPVTGALPPTDETFATATASAQAYVLAKREDVSRDRRIDLRRGALAFKGDFEYLRKRVGWIAAALLLVILSWIFASYTEYNALAAEAERQRQVLGERTKRLFGQPVYDHAEIAAKLAGDKVIEAPMPKRDAFDVLVELSRRMPDSVVHDLDYLEIKSKRVTMRGVVDAELKSEAGGRDGGVATADGGVGLELSPTDLVKQKLDEWKECFTGVRVGKVTTVEERRRYQMDIDSRCP